MSLIVPCGSSSLFNTAFIESTESVNSKNLRKGFEGVLISKANFLGLAVAKTNNIALHLGSCKEQRHYVISNSSNKECTRHPVSVWQHAL